jgi:hypothetical protein
MPRYVEGSDRDQVTLLPECLDDYIPEDNPVRAVDAFVEELDTKHHLIVAHEVTNVGNDRGQLANMADQARSAMGKKRLDAIADRGYFSGPRIKACEEAGITSYVPKPMTSNSAAAGRFSKADFIYIQRDDEYQCPAGERLRWRQTTLEWMSTASPETLTDEFSHSLGRKRPSNLHQSSVRPALTRSRS